MNQLRELSKIKEQEDLSSNVQDTTTIDFSLLNNFTMNPNILNLIPFNNGVYNQNYAPVCNEIPIPTNNYPLTFNNSWFYFCLY